MFPVFSLDMILWLFYTEINGNYLFLMVSMETHTHMFFFFRTQILIQEWNGQGKHPNKYYITKRFQVPKM